jgi:glycosyltransferase involved in cell wall biosynthesis
MSIHPSKTIDQHVYAPSTYRRGVHVSVVVPLYNEEANVRELHRRIHDVCEELKRPYEIIFINDGSTDNTEEVCRELSPLVLISFRKNFGQTAAFDAGIKQAIGNVIVTMDGDLQNDPRDIPRLLEKLNEGYDVVSGWRKKRQDTVSKHITSRVANQLRKLFFNDSIHDSGCALKAYRRECFKDLDLFGEIHRFIPALLTARGFKIAEIPVAHHPRRAGVRCKQIRQHHSRIKEFCRHGSCVVLGQVLI